MLARGNFDGIGVVVVVEVAKQKGGAPFLDDVGEVSQSLGKVGTVAGRLEGDEFTNDAKNMAAALLGRNEFLDAVAEKVTPTLSLFWMALKAKVAATSATSSSLNW